jgi:predicted transposase YdaD
MQRQPIQIVVGVGDQSHPHSYDTIALRYKFDNLSREDIAAMLGTNVDDIRAFREAKEEERRSLALKMLQEGATLDFVIKVTGFSAVQIQDIRSELR